MNGDITIEARLTLSKCCWSNITVHYFCRRQILYPNL